MRDAIIKKLNNHLAAGIRSEADLLYFMAEIRKLFEQEASKRRYPALSFYADWCLHSKIDRNIFADELLTKLDDALVRYANNKDPGAFFAVIVQEVSFVRLWAELKRFCGERDIALGVLLNERRFGLLLLDVILDSPVLTRKGLKMLKAFSLTRQGSFIAQNGQSVAFWSITTDGGTQYMGPLF